MLLWSATGDSVLGDSGRIWERILSGRDFVRGILFRGDYIRILTVTCETMTMTKTNRSCSQTTVRLVASRIVTKVCLSRSSSGGLHHQSSSMMHSKVTTIARTMSQQLVAYNYWHTHVATDYDSTWWIPLKSADCWGLWPVYHCRQLFNDFFCLTNSTQFIN